MEVLRPLILTRSCRGWRVSKLVVGSNPLTQIQTGHERLKNRGIGFFVMCRSSEVGFR